MSTASIHTNRSYHLAIILELAIGGTVDVLHHVYELLLIVICD